MINYRYLNKLYFKNDDHQNLLFDMLFKLNNFDDPYYVSFCYLASATGKSELLNYLCHDGIKVSKIKEIIKLYSSTEKLIIKLALHLFNDIHNFNSIDDLFSYSDLDNKKVILQALMFKYNIDL